MFGFNKWNYQDKTYTWNNITGVADTAEDSSFLLEINFYFYFLFYTCI